jgi:cytochrome c-type biogenesis protein CcmH/NrfG
MDKVSYEALSGGYMSVADELQKLAALRDAGVLTEAEFQEQKARVMSGQAGARAPGATQKKGGSYFPVIWVAMAVVLGVFLIVAVLSG